MTFFSQKSFNKPLGKSTTTIKSSGCLLTSCANWVNYIGLSTMNPLELNELFVLKGVFSGANINCALAAKALGVSYVKTYDNPNVVCVCETDHYKKVSVPQHFFLYNPKTKMRVDPLDLVPVWEKNDYHIVSYRVFTWNKPQATTIASKETLTPETNNTTISQPASTQIVQEQSTTLNPTPSQTTTTANPVIATPAYPTETVEKYNQNNLFDLIFNYLLKVWSSIKKR